MTKLPFVDAYFHLVDPFRPGFSYSFMRPESRIAKLGEHHDRLKGRAHSLDDFLQEARSCNLIGAVHGEAIESPDDPVKETRWLQQEAGRAGFPLVFVGRVNLQSPVAEKIVLEHLQYPNLRGLRHRATDPGFLDDPAFYSGYSLLEKYRLPCDIAVRPESMAKVRDLALRFPEVTVAVDHCGGVHTATVGSQRDREFFRAWKQGIQTVATAKNVVCKISDLTTFDHDWTTASLRPWVLACVETFGPRRCMFGSHWPLDTLFAPYARLIGAYAEIISEFSLDEQMDMFSRNAIAIYRIKPSSR